MLKESASKFETFLKVATYVPPQLARGISLKGLTPFFELGNYPIMINITKQGEKEEYFIGKEIIEVYKHI